MNNDNIAIFSIATPTFLKTASQCNGIIVGYFKF